MKYKVQREKQLALYTDVDPNKVPRCDDFIVVNVLF